MDDDMKELERLKKLLLESSIKLEDVKSMKDDEDDDELDPDFGPCFDDEDDEDDEDESNNWKVYHTDNNSDETFEEAISFLDDMVGMEEIKEKLMRLNRYVQWKKKLYTKGVDITLLPEPNLTFMFLGDPGTGKTTVAYRMGRILHSIGLLPNKTTMEFRREDLVGENYGSEENNTKEALNKSMGSVFLLDEAYQCFKQASDHRDPGYHILETMMTQFDKPGRCIIMAGYKKEMEELFKVNPGFRSRIPDENIIEFQPSSENLLMEVALNNFRKTHMQVTPGARKVLREAIHIMFVKKDRNFGNARVIRQLTEDIIINHANRIIKYNQDKDATKITSSDIRISIANLYQKKKTAQAKIGFVQ